MKKMMSGLKKILLITVIIGGIVFMVKYFDFPPDSMTGSAIKGVEKANKYSIIDTTEVQLVGEDIQILLQNDEFQLLLKDTIAFDELINSPKFIELVGDTEMDTVVLKEFIRKLK